MKSNLLLKVTAILVLSTLVFFSCKKSNNAALIQTPFSPTVSTFAGSGNAGSTNATGTSASFSTPSAVISDNIGGTNQLFIGDFGNNLIRNINISTTSVTSFAGSGASGLVNGPASTATFNGAANLALDAAGNLYVSDEENNVIRKISTSGSVTTFAGTGVAGYQNGPAATAQFNHPEGIVIDGNSFMYVSDLGNDVIRKIDLSTNSVSLFAGTGAAGFNNGPLVSASFNEPYGLAVDASNNLYIADILNNSIRKITVSTGLVSTYAGTGAKGSTNGSATSASFNYPLGCTFDSAGNLYVADTYNNLIRVISTSGTVTTLAGTGAQGITNGAAATATFNFPIGLTVNGTNLYIADAHNNVIRKITLAASN
jgi:hypothetical protein